MFKDEEFKTICAAIRFKPIKLGTNTYSSLNPLPTTRFTVVPLRISCPENILIPFTLKSRILLVAISDLYSSFPTERPTISIFLSACRNVKSYISGNLTILVNDSVTVK